jgi:hypothetical protein
MFRHRAHARRIIYRACFDTQTNMRRLNYNATEAYAKVSSVVKILFWESFFCRPGTVGDRFAEVSGGSLQG